MNQGLMFLKTFFQWIKHHFINNFVNKTPIILFVLVGLFAFFLYTFSLPLNQSKYLLEFSIWLIKFFGFHGGNDGDIQKVISTILSYFTILSSLLSAIYVFTYREQKSVSPSASINSRKNAMVILIISLIIFIVVFGCSIVTGYSSLLSTPGYEPSLSITKHFYSKIVLLILALFLLFCLIISFVAYLFRTMSVDKMLEDSVNQTYKILNTILYAHRSKLFAKLLQERYREFHFSLESVFQNLKFAAENNMNKEFAENISRFKKVIRRFNEKIDNDNNYVHSYLLENDKANILFVYQSALRSNLSLIGSIMKNKQYNKANELVSLYFDMYVNEETFIRVFQLNLNNYLDTIDTSDERQLAIFFNGLRRIPEEQTLITYKFLLMRLINKNQLKNLTNAVYAFKMYLEVPLLKNSLIVIYLQNLIKSIEISNYEITGFLIKFFITNISGQDINRGLITLKRNRNLFTAVWEADYVIEGLGEKDVYSIKINDETFDYCYKKAYVLLFAQHLYAIRNNLWFTKEFKETGYEIKLGKEFNEDNDSGYIISKVKAASSKYGLLFFQDDDILKAVYNELNLDFPNSTKENEKSLPQTLGLLVTKVFKL